MRIIAAPENRETLAAIVFAETSTLGLRIHEAERRVKARRFEEVETQWGPVRVKIAEDGSFAPEYDDCRRLARERAVPLRLVMQDATLAWLKNAK